MASELHPLRATEHIRASYLRYLKTIFPLKDDNLREQFWRELERPDRLVKGPMLEGAPPFRVGRSIRQLIHDRVLHPDFHQLCSDELPLDRQLYVHQEKAVEKVVSLNRNIVIATGTGSGKTESFLIPVLDHLLRERERGTLERPGVRALLLYPMNALANDQLKRLRRLLASFSEITFGRYTGETEEKQKDAKDKFYEQFPKEELRENVELISREEMRTRPPHILLTNYAMLEYLLLRPADCEFFDGETGRFWRFLVLDEAHTYNGATGIEMAMLLRRLKDRVVRSEPGRLRCIATSATLGRGGEDFPEVVKFASELFGERFEWDDSDMTRQDVVGAERVPVSALESPWGEGSPELYVGLKQALSTITESEATRLPESQNSQIFQRENSAKLRKSARLTETALRCGVPPQKVEEAQRKAEEKTDFREATNACLYFLLHGDGRVHRLREMLCDEMLGEKPRFLKDASREIFQGLDEHDAEEKLIDLVDLAVQAKPERESLALIPGRYHLFARALEGTFVCLQPHDAKVGQAANLSTQKLFLERHDECDICRDAGRKSKVFELAACQRCGQEYLVGYITSPFEEGLFGEHDNVSYFRQLTGDVGIAKGEKAYFLLEAQPASPEDEDEEVATGSEESNQQAGSMLYLTDAYTLCLCCGAVAPGVDADTGCDCPRDAYLRRRVERAPLKQSETELRKCIACGSRSTSEIVYRFLTGQDAPVSVLATALYQQLPASKEPEMQILPGQGRKLLIFSDSRQDAAFFAPYLERTYDFILRRRLIVKALAEDESSADGKLRLKDLVSRVQRQAEDAWLFEQKQSYDEQQRVVWTWLMQELTTWDRRNSLEGLGLVNFRLVKPRGWRAPQALLGEPWNLSEEESWTLIQILLDTLRQQVAVTFPDNVSPKEEAFAPRNREFYLRESESDGSAGIFSFLPKHGKTNRRIDFVTRLLAKTALSMDNVEEHAREALRILWRDFTSNSIWCNHLVRMQPRQQGIVYQLSHLFWEVVPSVSITAETSSEQWYQCNRCRNLSRLNVRGVCPTYRCEGQLIPYDFNGATSIEENHYRRLYLSLNPVALKVEEHTAQWTSTAAAKIQERFVKGELNALSCSTTFELGVDVGELQAVLMRNVPPQTANYVQRAGRAGRRTDSTAFALTYAQRRSHDLTHYTNPERIVAGRIHPPIVTIANEKIVRRHAHSVLFAAFFRWCHGQHNLLFPTVGVFFEQNAPALLAQYVQVQTSDVLEALKRIVPQELQTALGIQTWEWVEELMNTKNKGFLDKAQQEVEEDLEIFNRLEQEASAQRRYRDAGRYQRIVAAVRNRELLGFLGSRNVLPKYGFPVDVVELKTEHLHFEEAKKLELTRDLRLALSEYAPGSEIVAAKRVWVSRGLYHPPQHNWPEYYYAVCPHCGRFQKSGGKLDSACSACGEALGRGRSGMRGIFIVPEFGFVSDFQEPKKSGEARPPRTYTSRVFFSEYAETAPEFELEGNITPEARLLKRYSQQGKLAVINAGFGSRGFRVCQICGYAEAAPPPNSQARRAKKLTHRHLRANKECNGTLMHCHLGHEFLTDVLELRFEGALTSEVQQQALNIKKDFWLSLLYVLLEGASHALGIRREDLDGCLYHYSGAVSPAVMLFDDVPGGAG